MKKYSISILVFSMLAIPALSYGKIVPDCGSDGCHLNDLLTLINNVVDFIFVSLALPIAAIMFAYAGFKLVTSGGSTEARTKAKEIFLNTAIGLIFVAGAWLIVHTILVTLGYSGDSAFGLN